MLSFRLSFKIYNSDSEQKTQPQNTAQGRDRLFYSTLFSLYYTREREREPESLLILHVMCDLLDSTQSSL
jgi:hypothetical protein